MVLRNGVGVDVEAGGFVLRSCGLEMFSELEELLRAACSNCWWDTSVRCLPVGGWLVSGAVSAGSCGARSAFPVGCKSGGKETPQLCSCLGPIAWLPCDVVQVLEGITRASPACEVSSRLFNFN